VDSGYQGIQRFHAKSNLPKKKSKHHPLSAQDKKESRELARQRVLNEHVFARECSLKGYIRYPIAS
jgi:hypothetical protein